MQPEERKGRDKLEKFVDLHRDEFDSFEPRPDLWQDIHKNLPTKKEPTVIQLAYRHVWKYAAAVALLWVVGYGALHLNKATKTNQAMVTQSVPLASIAPEMAEVEAYYTTVINQKKQERSTYDLKAMGIEGDFKGELAKLDSAYVQLKKELGSNPNKQQVIDAMVQNLQMRIEVLNRQIEVLGTIKEIKRTTENGKATI